MSGDDLSSERTSPVTSRRPVAAIGLAIVLVGGVVLLVRASATSSDGSKGSATNTIASAVAKDAGEPLIVEGRGTIELHVRPATHVDGALEVKVIFEREGHDRIVDARVTAAEAGALRVEIAGGGLVDGRDGDGMLIVVVGRAGSLGTDPAAVLGHEADPTVQVVRQPVRLVSAATNQR